MSYLKVPKRTLRFGLSCAAVAGLTATAFAQDPEQSYYDTSSDSMVSYSAPPYAQLRDSTFTVNGSNATLTIHFNGTVPTSPGQMTVEALFDTADAGVYDRAVVYTKGYQYNSSPAIASGFAGVVNTNTWAKVANTTKSLVGDTLTLTCPVSAIGSSGPNTILIRYLPSSVDINAVGGGLSGAIVSRLTYNPNLDNLKTIVPGVPDASNGGIGTTAIIDQGKPGRIATPYGCPPQTGDPVSKTWDINHDGITDWDYGVNKAYGNNGRRINIFGLDFAPVGNGPDANGHYPDCFIVVVGTDSNANGKIDSGEIEFPIGQCIYYSGQNVGWVDSGTNVTHWINESWSGGRCVERTHYIYNPNTGQLTVWIDTDGQGPLRPSTWVYRGTPGAYPSWCANLP
jgi:hypothetical protein